MADQEVNFDSVRALLQKDLDEANHAKMLVENHAELLELENIAFALKLQLDEIKLLQAAQADSRMQRSIYAAILSDTELIKKELEDPGCGEPKMAKEDTYDDARLIQAAQAAATLGNSSNQASFQNAESTAILDLYIEVLQLDESSLPKTYDICADPFTASTLVALECRHSWCKGCVSRIFEQAILSERMWPPKCCDAKPISVPFIDHLTPAELRIRFEEKSKEWGAKDRTYCFL